MTEPSRPFFLVNWRRYWRLLGTFIGDFKCRQCVLGCFHFESLETVLRLEALVCFWEEDFLAIPIEWSSSRFLTERPSPSNACKSNLLLIESVPSKAANFLFKISKFQNYFQLESFQILPVGQVATLGCQWLWALPSSQCEHTCEPSARSNSPSE